MLRIQNLVAGMFLAAMTLAACAVDQPSRVDEGAVQISSVDELSNYVKTTPHSPLDHLSAAGKQHFIDSLVFTRDGLASYRYSELEGLTATEAHQILSLFGVENTIGMVARLRVTTDGDRSVIQSARPEEGFKDMRCTEWSTCEPDIGSICSDKC